MSLKKGIIKSDISHHFPIFVMINTSNCKPNVRNIKLTKRHFNEKHTDSFKNDLSNVNWSQIEIQDDANKSYNIFFFKFSPNYTIKISL